MLKSHFGACLLLMSSMPAGAAELKVVTTEPLELTEVLKGKCNAILRGRIEKFDSIKINDFQHDEYTDLDGVRMTGIDDKIQLVYAICLDTSDGGDFEGGLEIAEVLRRRGFATVVPKNGTCLSACAVAFLGGTIRDFGSDLLAPMRIMDVTAKVGFHAPLVPGDTRPGQLVPVEMAMDLFTGGVASVRELSRSLPERGLYEAGPTFPPALMLEMLAHSSSNDFVLIDTVDKAGAFNIRLAGVAEIAIGNDSVSRLCDNAIVWSSNQHSPFSSDRTGQYWVRVKSGENEWRRISSNEDQFDYRTIRGEVTPDHLKAGVKVNRFEDECLITGGKGAGDDFNVDAVIRGATMRRSFEPWATLPFFVPISALAGKPIFDAKPYRTILLPDKERTDQADDFDEPVENYLPHIQALQKLLLGRTMIVAEYTDGEPSYGAINFRKDGSVDHFWRSQLTHYENYSIVKNRICFLPPRTTGEGHCAFMERNIHSWRLRYEAATDRVEVIEHIRMGVILTDAGGDP